MITIDIFKNNDLFEQLSQYNHILDNGIHMEAVKKSPYPAWFMPETAVLNPTTRSYPNIDKLSYDPKWKIHLTIVNYMSIFIINLLYSKRKDVIIEDMGCGVGYLFLYLNKLGFKNFSAIDNFSHLNRDCLELFSTYIDGKVNINQVDINPHIINITIPLFPRRVMPDGKVFLELCLLANYHEKLEKDKSKMYINSNLELFINYYRVRRSIIGDNFKLLCIDSDDMTEVYCREDKYEEFLERILPYELK